MSNHKEYFEGLQSICPSGIEFLDAYLPSKPSKPIVKDPKEILDDACRTDGMVKTGFRNQPAASLILRSISAEEMHSLIQAVFEGAPDEIVGHKLCRLIARSRDRVLQEYDIEEAE